MRAARMFVDQLREASLLARTTRIAAHLYASLALTGKGHGTDVALLIGLEGETPEEVDVDQVDARIAKIRRAKTLRLASGKRIGFDEATDVQFHRQESLPAHPNGLRFVASGADRVELMSRTYYSVGGGFVIGDEAASNDRLTNQSVDRPFPYRHGDDLLNLADESGLSVSQMTLRNEACWRSESETRQGLLHIWQAMQNCVSRGCEREGILPGGLKVARRAPQLYRKLGEQTAAAEHDPLTEIDWVSLWAIAVNEENAAGGHVVTAPTNGAAGIIPAVLHHLVRARGSDDDCVVRFLLTAGAVGILYKLNASISGAEVGCQGEVGVACSMAAAALCESLGGTVPQVENAAEIGMEHNLGLTCDPIGGLVQVPCIERNAMGAVKAIQAASLALCGDGVHRVSLDRVIRTMRQTGQDMSTKYKETARGGLAVNVTVC